MGIDLDGKVALVTGAGNGLGREHALELGRRGACVIVNDLGGGRDGSGGGSDAADDVVRQIKSAGGEAVANYGSVADQEDAETMVQQAIDSFGRLDIVVNNAGILRDRSFAKMDMADFRLVMDVHVMGTVYVTRAAWPVMREQAYGRIVVTTSTSGLFGNFGQANYSTAKLGVVGFMNTLKQEGRKYNIHTNAIAPIATTRMTTDVLPEDVQGDLKPELVTPGVMYLCTDDAPNGVILQAAGGRFFLAQIVENQGVDLGDEASLESVAARFEEISNMAGAGPRER